jgi:hypothetical protein
MPNCGDECYRIVTKWESYTVETPLLQPPGCPTLSDQEAEDHVADEVKNHNKNHSVEEPPCLGGCNCMRYEEPQKPVPLKRRNERKRVMWIDPATGCVYVVYFTVSVHETRTALGICR